MSLTVKHKFHTPVPDNSTPNEVGPDDWNDEHEVTGDIDQGQIPNNSIGNEKLASPPAQTIRGNATDATDGNVQDVGPSDLIEETNVDIAGWFLGWEGTASKLRKFATDLWWNSVLDMPKNTVAGEGVRGENLIDTSRAGFEQAGVGAKNINDKTITAEQLADQSVGLGQLVEVTTPGNEAKGIANINIIDKVIRNAKLYQAPAHSLKGNPTSDGSLSPNDIESNTLTEASAAPGASDKIIGWNSSNQLTTFDGTKFASEPGPGSIEGGGTNDPDSDGQIAAATINAYNLATDAVDADALGSNSVVNASIQDGQIQGAKLYDTAGGQNGVQTKHLNNAIVTTAKLPDSTSPTDGVTNPKLAHGAGWSLKAVMQSQAAVYSDINKSSFLGNRQTPANEDYVLGWRDSDNALVTFDMSALLAAGFDTTADYTVTGAWTFEDHPITADHIVGNNIDLGDGNISGDTHLAFSADNLYVDGKQTNIRTDDVVGNASIRTGQFPDQYGAYPITFHPISEAKSFDADNTAGGDVTLINDNQWYDIGLTLATTEEIPAGSSFEVRAECVNLSGTQTDEFSFRLKLDDGTTVTYEDMGAVIVTPASTSVMTFSSIVENAVPYPPAMTLTVEASRIQTHVSADGNYVNGTAPDEAKMSIFVPGGEGEANRGENIGDIPSSGVPANDKYADLYAGMNNINIQIRRLVSTDGTVNITQNAGGEINLRSTPPPGGGEVNSGRNLSSNGSRLDVFAGVDSPDLTFNSMLLPTLAPDGGANLMNMVLADNLIQPSLSTNKVLTLGTIPVNDDQTVYGMKTFAEKLLLRDQTVSPSPVVDDGEAASVGYVKSLPVGEANTMMNRGGTVGWYASKTGAEFELYGMSFHVDSGLSAALNQADPNDTHWVISWTPPANVLVNDSAWTVGVGVECTFTEHLRVGQPVINGNGPSHADNADIAATVKWVNDNFSDNEGTITGPGTVTNGFIPQWTDATTLGTGIDPNTLATTTAIAKMVENDTATIPGDVDQIVLFDGNDGRKIKASNSKLSDFLTTNATVGNIVADNIVAFNANGSTVLKEVSLKSADISYYDGGAVTGGHIPTFNGTGGRRLQSSGIAASQISTNASNIATNTGDISTNAGNIATNASDISALQGDIIPKGADNTNANLMISLVAALPGTPNANTLYFVTS